MGMKHSVHLLNIYGPYDNRCTFWESVNNNGFLNLPNLILEGDMNFTWFIDEFWGAGRPCDPLADFFLTFFGDAKLQDIAPMIISSTWSNGRDRTLSIAKQLDIFFMSDTLCDLFGNFRS